VWGECHENVRQSVRAIAAASLLGVLIAAGAASGVLGHDRRGAPDHRFYPLWGVDVSHYQGAIDWPAAAGDGLSFAYIKATEGVESRDPRFARNWQGARRAGLRVGAYHYFIFCRSGRAQAHNFLAVAPREESALPPAVDLEFGRGCRTRLTGATVHRELADYLAVVEARNREHAVLYVTPAFYAAYRDYLPKRPMWRRSILAKPAPNASWRFWQYRSRGRVAGIRTFVDLNVYNASRPSPRRQRLLRRVSYSATG
jgi:lysozyme